MRVAVVASMTTVNAVYRALPLLGLSRRGHAVHVDADGQALLAGALRGVDVVHVYRQQHPRVRRALRALRASGTAIVWDNDDYVMPPQARAGEQQARRAQAEIMQTIPLAHLVTTTSQMLAEQYRAWGAADVQVVENYLPQHFARPPAAHGEGVLVGWVAAGEHVHDVERLGLRATFQRLLATHPEARVATIGVSLELASERYAHTDIVEYRELPDHIGAFDVGIAPIADIPFNRAKSNVKLKEYAAMGVPWLASPIGPYTGLGEKQGGRLVADDRWHDELERLIRDERARRKLAKAGRRWAEGERVERNLDRWEGALTQALATARSLAADPA
ncbi:MAG TPA: glycosyltransferase [Conexibacter sp.]|nr:glycosyltransferase [Conexibacter sp.]